MDDTMPKFFIYTRKSTDDTSRQIRSIGDQIAELRELSRRENLNVIEVLVEKQTAKKPGRPIFNEMLDRVERGEASGILAWHPDRLARNWVDGGRIIHLVDTGTIKVLRFPNVPFDPTASGKFLLGIMFGQSKYYVDNLAENIKRGLRQKVKSGIWPQMTPLGYRNDRKTRTISPDRERASLVRKTFELYATGDYTLTRLANAVASLGLTTRRGRPLSRAQCHRLLRNPIYYGIIRYTGEFYEGRHKPIISKNLFDTVQQMMTKRSKPKTPKLKPYIYRGVFHCGECGCYVTTETQKGHNYLRCTKRVKLDCSQRYVREEVITEQIASYLRQIALPSADADWMISELEAERGREVDSSADVRQKFQKDVHGVEDKLDRLTVAYLDKAINVEEFKTAKNRLIEEKQTSKDRLAAVERGSLGWFEPAIRFIKAAVEPKYVAEEKNPARQRDFVKKVGSNLTISDRHLSVIPRGAWKLVVDQGPFAQHNAAPSCDDAAFLGEKSPYLQTAERGRFELPRRFKPSTAFPVLLLQPLGHLSRCASFLGSSRGSLADRRGVSIL
jgi:site-specific DNA recombinase